MALVIVYFHILIYIYRFKDIGDFKKTNKCFTHSNSSKKQDCLSFTIFRKFSEKDNSSNRKEKKNDTQNFSQTGTKKILLRKYLLMTKIRSFINHIDYFAFSGGSWYVFVFTLILQHLPKKTFCKLQEKMFVKHERSL